MGVHSRHSNSSRATLRNVSSLPEATGTPSVATTRNPFLAYPPHLLMISRFAFQLLQTPFNLTQPSLKRRLLALKHPNFLFPRERRLIRRNCPPRRSPPPRIPPAHFNHLPLNEYIFTKNKALATAVRKRNEKNKMRGKKRRKKGGGFKC